MKNDFKINELVYHIKNDSMYLIEEIEILDNIKIYYLNKNGHCFFLEFLQEKCKMCKGVKKIYDKNIIDYFK